MKRTKKLPSRKAKTLRRGIVLAVCLVGILALYQPCLTPGQAIRASETELGWEKTQVLGETQVLSRRVTLSANRDGLMTTVFRPFQPLSPLLGRQGRRSYVPPTPLSGLSLLAHRHPLSAGGGKGGFPPPLRPGRTWPRLPPFASTINGKRPCQTSLSRPPSPPGRTAGRWSVPPSPSPPRRSPSTPPGTTILDQAGHILYAGPLSYTAPVSSIDPH